MAVGTKLSLKRALLHKGSLYRRLEGMVEKCWESGCSGSWMIVSALRSGDEVIWSDKWGVGMPLIYVHTYGGRIILLLESEVTHNHFYFFVANVIMKCWLSTCTNHTHARKAGAGRPILIPVEELKNSMAWQVRVCAARGNIIVKRKQNKISWISYQLITAS